MSEDVFGVIEGQPDEGAYHVTVTEILRKESKQSPGEFFRVWNFQTPEGMKLSGSTSLASGPSSKAYEWSLAILGRPPTKGEPMTILYGKPAIAAVEHNDAGYAKVKNVYPVVAAQPPVPQAVAVPTSTVTHVSSPTVTTVPATNGSPENVPWDAEALTEDAIPF